MENSHSQFHPEGPLKIVFKSLLFPMAGELIPEQKRMAE